MGVLPDDRAYLIDLIGSRTCLPPAQATARADRAIVDAKENLSKARKIGILIGFAAGASVLLGAVAAWLAAAAGGLHRDDARDQWRPNVLGRPRAL
jgi:dienelactone hydrolase